MAPYIENGNPQAGLGPEVAESPEKDALDPLIGTKLSTAYGVGVVEDTKDYEGRPYATIRLDNSGTLNIPKEAAEHLQRKEKQRSLPKGMKGTRLPNVIGHIRMYNPSKGWGFIICDEFEGDIFLHSKHMIGAPPPEYIGHFQSSMDGNAVKFDLDLQHRNRPQALNVCMLDGAKAAEAQDALAAAAAATALGPVSAAAAAALKAKQKPAAKAKTSPTKGLGKDSPLTQSPPSPAKENAELHGMTGPGKKRAQIRMRGLPFSATTYDICEFFAGYGVRMEDVTVAARADGSNSGEAYVQFAREDLAASALKEKNMQHMGNRYIELFPAKPGVDVKAPSGAKQGSGVLSPTAGAASSGIFGMSPAPSSSLSGSGFGAPGDQAYATMMASYARAMSMSMGASSTPPPQQYAAAAMAQAAYAASMAAYQQQYQQYAAASMAQAYQSQALSGASQTQYPPYPGDPFDFYTASSREAPEDRVHQSQLHRLLEANSGSTSGAAASRSTTESEPKQYFDRI